jgi:hypothetical protein
MSTDKRHPCRICKGCIACKSLGHTSPNKSTGNFSGNGVLVSVSLLLMLLLHQVKKKKSKPKEEWKQAWCALLAATSLFTTYFDLGFHLEVRTKMYESVQNCGVWTSCLWSECWFYHERQCHSVHWMLNCLPYKKKVSLINFSCLHLWLLFCGCPSPSSAVQQARAQLQPETYSTEMAPLIDHSSNKSEGVHWADPNG